MIKVLISDFHAGCQASIWHSLNSIGIQASIVSFSAHSIYLESMGIPRSCVQEINPINPIKPSVTTRIVRRIKREIMGKSTYLRFFPYLDNNYIDDELKKLPENYDLAICAFPPKMYLSLKRAGIAKKILVLSGHRFDLGIGNRTSYFKEVLTDWDSRDIHFMAMNEYDRKYMEYYLKKNIHSLEPFREDIVTIARENSKQRSNLPLFAPALVRQSNLMKNITEMSIQNVKAVPFQIKHLYKNYDYADLCEHGTYIPLPYSTFSISLDELFSTGARMLFPSDRVLADFKTLDDVKLWPTYRPVEGIGEMDPDGPNSLGGISPRWLKYASWNYRVGTERWDSLEGLCTLLNQKNNALDRNISAEADRCKELSEKWRTTIGNIVEGEK